MVQVDADGVQHHPEENGVGVGGMRSGGEEACGGRDLHDMVLHLVVTCPEVDRRGRGCVCSAALVEVLHTASPDGRGHDYMCKQRHWGRTGAG